MTSIGERLRRQRLQQRISLEQVSLETKIGIRLLEAIEAEQFDKLPGGVFRRNFVLQYARALGMDTDDIAGELKNLNQFDDEVATPALRPLSAQEEPNRFAFPLWGNLSGVGGSTLGSLVAAVGVMLACALIYSWWQSPKEIRTTAPKTAAVSPPSAKPPTAAPAVPRSEPTAGPAGQSDRTSAPVRVGLSADEKTWISVSSDGKNIFANALLPHETKMVEASEKVRILIGNAGGLEISLNGKPIGPIGPRGQIRIVELTPAGFQIVPRKSPTFEPL